MSYKNATPIDMLPELEDLEREQRYGVNFGESVKYQPGISGGSYATNATYPGAAMVPTGEAERIGRFIRGGHTTPIEAGMLPNQVQPDINMTNKYGTYIEKEETSIRKYNLPADSPSCINVAEHISLCPICSKFYNNDKTVYIIAIVVLSVICILLMKKVLDV